MIGYSEAELRGRSPADIAHEDDRAATEAIIAAHAAGDPVMHRLEKRYRRKDGDVTRLLKAWRQAHFVAAAGSPHAADGA
jgi:PAS domain S-box-containing protein